jgi:hypothetical protein
VISGSGCVMQGLRGRRVSWPAGGWAARSSVHLLDSVDEVAGWGIGVSGEVAGRGVVGVLPEGWVGTEILPAAAGRRHSGWGMMRVGGCAGTTSNVEMAGCGDVTKRTPGDCPRHHPLHGAMQRKAAAALALDHDAVVCWSIDRLRFSRCGRTHKYASIKYCQWKTDASTGHLALPAPG